MKTLQSKVMSLLKALAVTGRALVQIALEFMMALQASSRFITHPAT